MLFSSLFSVERGIDMVKTYPYNDNTQLSPHFNITEFRCKCGGKHDTPLDDTLIDKLEQLFTALDCGKIIVSSGYRCYSHDKSVGGNGTGYHTKGMAADICCYNKKGSIISSKLVCCKAQDIGFGGMANINTSYTYTHVDVRTGGRWFGNEIYGYGSLYDHGKPVTDFYEYFGIQRDDDTPKPTKPTAVLKEGSKGEDVKWLQEKLKNKGFYNGSISGEFDIITLGAVLAFQMKSGLAVDGICGNQTYSKL